MQLQRQESHHFINVKNSIFFWQDLAANGTNIEVAEAAKAHLDSYRYKRHFNYILISNSLKFELFEVQLNWGFIISHHYSMKYLLPSNIFYPLYFAPRLLSQTKRWSLYLITRQPVRSSALYTTPICFSLSVMIFFPPFYFSRRLSTWWSVVTTSSPARDDPF